MRIGIEAFRIFRKEKHGMDIAAIELIRQLQRLDTANEYFIFCMDMPDDSILHRTSNFQFIQLPAVPYPVAEQLYLPYLVIKHQIDLLHSTGSTAPVFVTCRQFITLHDIIFLDPTLSGKAGAALHQRLGAIYRKLIAPSALRKAEKVFTVSNSEKENILKKNSALLPKLEMIYNAVAAHFKVKPKATVLNTAARYNLYSEPYLFMQGNSDPKKNVEGVLGALFLLQQEGKLNFRLILSDLTEDRLVSLLRSNNWISLKEKIKLTGYINNTDLPDVYNMATAFIYPSIHESFGIPLLEAMACGTPVITSNCSAMPEIAGEAALYINPLSAPSIAEGIYRMMNYEDLRSEFTLKGLERCRRFSWNRSAAQLLRHYQQPVESSMNASLEI